MQHNDKYIKEILEYLGNKMSEEDRYAFERRMEADPFLMDAVEGYEGMDAAQIQEELENLQAKLSTRNNKRIVPMWIRAAASIALIIGIGSLLLLNDKASEKGLVSDNIKPVEKEIIQEEDMSSVPSGEIIDKKQESTELIPFSVEEIDEEENAEEVFVSPKPKKSFNKRSAKKAVIAKRESTQDVDLTLRFEDGQVKARRDLVGQMEGVSINEVEGSGIMEDLIVEAKTSTSIDTSMTNYRGRVVDEAGVPLAGVQVRNTELARGDVNGYVSNSTVTDTEGNFEIKAGEDGTVLKLSSLGFKDQLATAENDSVGELIMKPDNLAIDEVAIGYGAERKVKKYLSAEVMDLGGFKLNEAIPAEGLKRMIRRIQKELIYPYLPMEDEKEVVADVFVSASGQVTNVFFIYQNIDIKFQEALTSILKQTKWEAPRVDGAPVNSYKRVEFTFDVSK